MQGRDLQPSWAQAKGEVSVLLVVVTILAHVLAVSICRGTSKSSVVRDRFSEDSLELKVGVFAEALIVV